MFQLFSITRVLPLVRREGLLYGTLTWTRGDEWQGQRRDCAQYILSVPDDRAQTTGIQFDNFGVTLPKISLMY